MDIDIISPEIIIVEKEYDLLEALNEAKSHDHVRFYGRLGMLIKGSDKPVVGKELKGFLSFQYIEEQGDILDVRRYTVTSTLTDTDLGFPLGVLDPVVDKFADVYWSRAARMDSLGSDWNSIDAVCATDIHQKSVSGSLRALLFSPAQKQAYLERIDRAADLLY